MKLHYMVGKLVTWGGRWETLFSPWRIRQTMDRDGPKYLIPILHPIFSVPVISLQLTWGGDGGIPQLWCFSSDNFWAALLGSNVYLREKILFSQLFWYNRYLISKTSVTVQCRHQVQELLGKLPLCSLWPYYKVLTGPGPGSLQMENSTDPQQSQ